MPPPASQPLIPEKYLDAPSQRLYYLSLGLLCQAIKLVDILWYWTSGSEDLALCRKWLLVDFIYILSLRQLRIPRLTYSRSVVLLQIALLFFFDSLLFGGITINAPWSVGLAGRGAQHEFATPEPTNFFDLIAPLTFGLISSGSKDGHLLGQHTVRMSPISTARLNPYGSTFCLQSHHNSVLIPILLNNTNVVGLRYSLTPLDYVEGKSNKRTEYIDLSAKDLKSIEQARLESLQVARLATPPTPDSDDYDEYDDDDDDTQSRQSQAMLQNTQSLVHIRASKPGILRLVRVLDSSNTEARLVIPTEIVIVPCPRAKFIDNGWNDVNVRCAGQEQDVQLMINVFGIPPLSLRWLKIVNGKREHFLVEGIEGSREPTPVTKTPVGKVTRNDAEIDESDKPKLPQEVKVPLTISLDTIGTYVYALEEVVDGIGNIIPVKSETESGEGPVHSTSSRSLMVLRRPSMTFKLCGPENPTSLLIGSEAKLLVAATEADSSDAPWEIEMSYQPRVEDDDDSKKRKPLKPWKKTIKTQGSHRELIIPVSSPGDYSLLSVKGKYCQGDILAPETCRVIQKPLPSAEIQWKRIHECSGDIGVSATLVFHGTPPFQVYYHMQRDNEPPRELHKMFSGARGELTLQPDRSGHYTFTFVELSDANYRRVELKEPGIEQVVHPLATVDFAANQRDHGKGKRTISSCSGDTVGVDVEMKGTGPWTLEVQVIGPKTSEIMTFDKIETPQKTLHVPVPNEVDKEGGTFEIDLLSVEDAYKCKRPINVPGISVDVRRTKPTAKFYGSVHDGRVIVLENHKAELPLRLTGDGPWRIKYRHVNTNKVLASLVTSPNGNLPVTDKGVYELLEVSDSKCPGLVVASESTYTVGWVPRPSAKLSLETKAEYESYNGSHILPPICEGIDDHVDLDLTGRAPFQIMYNIALGIENAGTRVLDQPRFNSIQARTRFQLQTSIPGRIYYEVKQIGDAAYPLAKHKSAIIPRSERLLFEQQVFPRPLARFKNRNRLTYCSNDVFVPTEPGSADGMIVLEGTPPFKLELSIKDISASQTELRSVQVFTHTWNVNLPSYMFKSIGPHLVSVESIVDSSGCAQAMPDPFYSSVWVDVAENAAIIPFDRRIDYCVGEATQFQLEGIPPWSITYRINDRAYTQEIKTSPFSLLQQQPGEFAITSIAHQQKMCKTSVTDLHMHLHPLPSAQVGNGKRIYQDIHEGDQAEIVFTLAGEPPFTFTYQRSEPSTKKGGKPGKVLETHTVSRVMTHEYSIFSALEGTWTVTSISDRYCRYPPPVPEGTLEKR